MTLKEISSELSKIGSLSMTTLDGNTMHSRIISIAGTDEDGIYFLTMDIKPFYHQLKKNSQVSLCGIYPSGRKDGINKDGQPYWPPGFSLRINGEAREVTENEIKEKSSYSKLHKYTLEEAARYPSMKLFCIVKGKGEVFDYDFELENREYKLLRKRFAFGGETFGEPGVYINPDECLSCGECFEACTFNAIVEGDDTFIVSSERCDECGSCVVVCPTEAIEVSKNM